MNKKILKQALLFENETPVYSNVKELCEVAVVYQDENNLYFLQAKRGQKENAPIRERRNPAIGLYLCLAHE